MIQKRLLIHHYETWAENTNNPMHRRYALNQIKRIKMEQPLWADNPRGSMFYHKKLNKFFTGATEAANFFGTTRWHINRTPQKFGLTKEKL